MSALQSKKGFSLIEVLITLVILAVSLLAIAGLSVTTVGNNAYGRNMTEAVTYAQDLLEEFRAMRWETFPKGRVPISRPVPPEFFMLERGQPSQTEIPRPLRSQSIGVTK